MLTTPLAWKNLTHNPRRLAVACGGVGFAVLLMYMELGFLNALLDSNVEIIRRIRGDLVIVSKAKFALAATDRFPLQRIYQARACRGVDVYPVYLETPGAVLRRDDEKGFSIRVIAFDLSQPLFEPQLLEQYREFLRRPGTAIADSKSNPDYGIPVEPEHIQDYQGELTGRKLGLVGQFTLCTDFANDGNLLMSAANFARFFPRRVPGGDPLSSVDLGVVQIRPDSRLTLREAKAEVARQLPQDVLVFTRDEFIHRERVFWRTNTPVGYIFLVGTVIGFVVGVIICYQIIYADIADHLSEFATLKAMGYTNAYFISLIVGEGLYLSLLGFLPGALASFALYELLAARTGLLMEFSLGVSAIVLFSTMTMCISSGLLALRKLLRADPASLF